MTLSQWFKLWRLNSRVISLAESIASSERYIRKCNGDFSSVVQQLNNHKQSLGMTLETAEDILRTAKEELAGIHHFK